MEIIDQAAAMIEQGGIEAWSRVSTEDILGAEEAKHYTKSTDILEVWFDSGSTFWHVLRGTHPSTTTTRPRGRPVPGRPRPAPRLVPQLAAAGVAPSSAAPLQGLLTHGFTVDGQGKKMSKSLGNTVAPQDVSSKMGAEIIRLWVASTDYSGDLGIDDKILARVVDAYRRIRNTLRFLLANTSDFDASNRRRGLRRDAGDRPVRAGPLGPAAAGDPGPLQVYEFHPVVAKLQLFCSEDLGGFYLDVLKDRLYTTPPRAWHAARPRPRSPDHPGAAALDGALPVLHGRGSLEDRGPQRIHLPGEVHRAARRRRRPAGQVDAPSATWSTRTSKWCAPPAPWARPAGRSHAHGPEDLALLQSLKDDLKFVFITSAATAVAIALTTTVKASEHAKCERCWHYREDVGVN
jgi:isoleucyl-tRNA synthetase